MQIADTIIAAKQAGKWQSQRYYRPAAGGHTMDEKTHKRLTELVATLDKRVYDMLEELQGLMTDVNNVRITLELIDPEKRNPLDPMAMARAKKVLEQIKQQQGCKDE